MRKLFFIITVVFLESSCEKDPMIPHEGMYIGTMHTLNESVDAYLVYTKKDTSYLDTFIVQYKNDSVLFLNNGKRLKFKLDNSGSYSEPLGVHTYYTFKFSDNNKSLQYSYRSWGGFVSSYNKTNEDFIGEKQ